MEQSIDMVQQDQKYENENTSENETEDEEEEEEVPVAFYLNLDPLINHVRNVNFALIFY